MSKKTILNRVILVILYLLTFTGTPSFAGDGIKTPTIAAMVFLTDQEFFQMVQAGYSDAARASGINLLQSSSKLNLDTETRLIDRYISMGVDALIVSPFHQEKSATAIQRAHDKGIRTIISCVPLEGGYPDATIASNDRQLGSIVGKTAKTYIDKKAGKRVKIAVLAFDDRQPIQSGLRVSGFSDEVTKSPGVLIVSRQNAWAPAMAINVAGEIISENPDLDIIFSANEGGTIGAVMAVNLAGKADTIKVFGVDSSRHITEMLLSEDKILQAVAVQRPYEIALEAMTLAMKAIEGLATPETVHVPGFVLNRESPGEISDYRKYLEQILR